MLNIFKQKRKQLQEQPLQYWEEYSYIHALSRNDDKFLLTEECIDRVRQLIDVKVIGYMLPVHEEGKQGVLFIEYKGEEYEFRFYYVEHEVSHLANFQRHFFLEKEMDEVQKATMALSSYMKFGKDVRSSYILQLKLLQALMPNTLAFEDESAEKLINRKWVELAVNSKLPCDFKDLYTVQAVMASDTDIWIHTHGLARCSIAELEILHSSKSVYNHHYSIISTLANMVLEGAYDEEKNYAIIGQFINMNPIIVRKISWTEGILQYDSTVLGTENDRKNSHNSKSEIIFIINEENEISLLEEVNTLLANNPIFYISNAETLRMKNLALERFSYVRKVMAMNDKENYTVLIKMGLITDHGEQSDNKEHIWFELLRMEDNILNLKLTQEPYDIAALHEGDEGTYFLEEMTDWLLYTPFGRISPNMIYLLDINMDEEK